MTSQSPAPPLDPAPDPQTPSEFLQRAWSRLAGKNIEGADDDFNQALRMDDQLVDVFYGLGLVRLQQEQEDAALQAFEQVLALIKAGVLADMPQRGTVLRNLTNSQIQMIKARQIR